MRELDTLLTRYLDDSYPVAGLEEQQAFRALLELTDPLLWAYVLGQQVPADPVTRRVIEHISATRA
jgi:succinate dehydrogenase flavin-adding protein (antitoxin of CptAB toxin-antitoxin module)